MTGSSAWVRALPCSPALPSFPGGTKLCNCSWTTLGEEQLLLQPGPWGPNQLPSFHLPQKGALGMPLHFPALRAPEKQLDSSISFFFFSLSSSVPIFYSSRSALPVISRPLKHIVWWFLT